MIIKKVLLTLLVASWAAPVWAGREAYETLPGQVESKIPINFLHLEPAAGPAEPTAGGHGTSHTEEATDHGNSHGQAKPKDLTGPAPLPAVRIGGRTVRRALEEALATEQAVLPEALQDKSYPQRLQQRLNFTAFVHNPRLGPTQASLTLVLFEDLGCLPCEADHQTVQRILAPYLATHTSPTAPVSLTTQVVWVHAPSSRWQSTNLAAFYGKVAARQDRFWEYRQAMLAQPDRQSETAFGVLSQLGLDPRHTRQSTLTEARRFYRELDADALQARTLGISTSPVVLVNGIRVGEQGLPLTLLPDVIRYVENRLAAGLPEPPR